MKFLSELELRDLSDCDKNSYLLLAPLIFDAGFADITVPAGFITDLASVPRVPIAYLLWGDRAHREAVLHDYLYRINAVPDLSRANCDWIFREAMISRGNSWWVAEGMYLGVRTMGWLFYKKNYVSE